MERDTRDPLRAVIALHPTKSECIAVALGDQIRIRESSGVQTVQVNQDSKAAADGAHTIIRSMVFSPDGAYLAAGGDDKMLYLYKTDDWHMVHAFSSRKKISSVSFSSSGEHIFAATKYGDVLVAPVLPDGNGSFSEMALLMGHFCSIITCIKVSRNNMWLASCDREGKVRVTVIPSDPMQGAHEIVSFCLGHEKFVSACSFIVPKSGNELIISGGGDGLIKLWNPVDGHEMDSVDLGKPILTLASSVNQDLVFAVLDGSNKVSVLSLDDHNKIVRETVSLEIPVVTGADTTAQGQAWFVGGPIGSESGLRVACMQRSGNTWEHVATHDSLSKLENCSKDDTPLFHSYLPENLDKKRCKDTTQAM